MSSNTLIIILSGLVIFSYLFDQFAKKSRIPSVLLLLGLGIGLHYATDYLQIKTVDFLRVLPMLGTIGLIMIVLEGALELEYHSSKRKVILKSFASALGLLVFTTGVITVLINYVTHASLDNCVLNAIPLSVISSAIAIPSVANLTGENREFIIYESTFSDILGIIFFNFMLNNSHPTPGAVMGLGGEILLTIAVSLGACLLLIFLLRKISHHIKFFLIIAVMILLYGIGKHFHLSSLILVLVFGLLLTNIEKINFPWFQKIFVYEQLNYDTHLLAMVSGETAFILRTFFFIIFGFTMKVEAILDPQILLLGGSILVGIYLVRYLFLRTLLIDLIPVLFINPRGLISVLLFYSIPEANHINGFGEGALFLIILGSTLMMTVGLVAAIKRT